MKLANKNLNQIFKDAGLDLSALTPHRKIEIISVYLTWIRLLMNTWQMTSYCLDGITFIYQTVHLWMVYCTEMVFMF
ncbi:uncharacterized protein LOC108038194 [Drosophila rhopaloa]|uniref:Uncharacterized protein LOC108038194 n=1 Tax=Drosophila rhopaloa TaxID=1041015 RepID=A0A6P4E595_DRORH|nr:uncharacterized protein LOC108038194 [Drosophila rhopaloa]